MSKYVFSSVSLFLLAASAPANAAWWKFWEKPKVCEESLTSHQVPAAVRPVDLDVVQRIKSLGLTRRVGQANGARLASMQSYEILTVVMAREYRALTEDQRTEDVQRLVEDFLPLELQTTSFIGGSTLHLKVDLNSLNDRDLLIEHLATQSELQVIRTVIYENGAAGPS